VHFATISSIQLTFFSSGDFLLHWLCDSAKIGPEPWNTKVSSIIKGPFLVPLSLLVVEM